ncbi:MAG TPA: acyl-CoA thioesterase [Acidobacteriota bacterium]|nr:acyl-CoA thioesterase [Acidobacteriota bacterium]
MAQEKRESKRAETVWHTEIVQPWLTNVLGTMFGGKVLEMMDVTCAIAAARFCKRDVVTISSERVDFKVPIRAGRIVELAARVVFTGRTSMTVKVDVYSQHFAEESKQLCTTGYFNFVALDRTGRHTVPVPELIVETEEEQRDWEIAEQLRRNRQA